MYLTRFRINAARTGARRLLASPQVLHAAVMSSFAEPPAHGDTGPRVLWRLDQDTRAQIVLYLVSPARPDLTHLVEQAGWPTTATWQTYDYTTFLSGLVKGGRWAFRLTANPVHAVRRNADEPTKRTAHVTPHHQAAWLLKRQEQAGFRVMEMPPERRLPGKGDEHGLDTHELMVHNRRSLDFRKRGKQSPVSLTTVTFSGRLEVSDPDALRHTLTTGLGKAKAYGCGLLTLAPAE